MKDIVTEIGFVIDWLSHPAELGCKPNKIQFTKRFTTEDGIECMIFKYKKNILSPWLLAISSDAGIFSEQQKYVQQTEVEDATKLIEFLKQYWINQANDKNDREERAKSAGTFVGFALLKEPLWDSTKFEKDYTTEWGENLIGNPEESVSAKVYSFPEFGEKTLLAISLVESPVTEDEIEYSAQSNYMWSEAAKVTKSHKAHLIISVLGADDAKVGARLYAKVITTICHDSNTLGLYHNQVVLQPSFIIDASKLMKKNMFPLLSLVWFALRRTEKGLSAYTVGLIALGKDEIEILNTNEAPSVLRDFLFNIVSYIVEEDVVLHAGETIGVDNKQRLKIDKSEGVNVKVESLKIVYV